MVGKRPGQNPSGEHSLAEASPDLLAVLESASRLQQMVPDAVLVGGSAAALYAGHRDSYDHDHVLADLRDRFEVVLEALESEGEWVTNRVVPGKIILGQLGDIEAGVRQMVRTRPLADPRPKDSSVTRQLDAYRNLAVRWANWGEVRSVCRQLAAEMLEAEV